MHENFHTKKHSAFTDRDTERERGETGRGISGQSVSTSGPKWWNGQRQRERALETMRGIGIISVYREKLQRQT